MNESSGKKYHNPFSLKALWFDDEYKALLEKAPELQQTGKNSLKNKIIVLCSRSLQTFKAVYAEPFTTIISTFIISLIFTILCSIILIVKNLDVLLSSSTKNISMTVFLKEGVNETEIDRMLGELKKDSQVDYVERKSKQENFAEFKKSLGKDSKLLEGLDKHNPLPNSIEMNLKPATDIESTFDRYLEKFSKDPFIEHVHLDRGLILKLGKSLKYIRFFCALIVTFVLFVSGFLIYNIIRLALNSHKEEIEIMQLVGATNSFIRIPFVIEGIIQGIIGSIVSVMCLYAGAEFLKYTLFSSYLLSSFTDTFLFLSFPNILLIVFLGGAVGYIGSYFAVEKFLDE